MATRATLTSIALATVLVCSNRLNAGDPGELFPDVPYSTIVGPSPVTHEEENLKVSTPTPATPAQATPPIVAPPSPPVSSNAKPPTDPSAQTKPADAEGTSTRASQIWFPYAHNLLDPLLSAADQQQFDSQDAAGLVAALNGSSELKLNASDRLFRRAASTTGSPELQRYLYLHSLGLAIRAKAPSADRDRKGRAVLPLLNEPSLAVGQARTECLESLAGGAATGTLATQLVHAYANLARFQAQAGYPREAYASLSAARKWLQPSPPSLLTQQLATTHQWVKRAQAAAFELPALKSQLINNSRDPAANTELAMIHLGLYGDLGKALEFAIDSDKPELHKLASLAKELDLKTMMVDSPADARKSLPVIAAMVDLAKSAIGPDRYLIAYHAKFRLDELATVLPAKDIASLNAAIMKASDEITDPLEPADSLDPLADPKSQEQAASPAAGSSNGTGNGGAGGRRHRRKHS
jgi:hypothetical protein